MTPIALTIAGSDSSGGAGIQADLKTFSALGVYGASAITAVTAQNTTGVSAVHDVPVDMVQAQIDAVFSDCNVAAVKIGMLSRSAIIAAVAERLAQHPAIPVVLDPVMVATTGARLISADATGALIAQLLPRATLITPNLHESAVLIGENMATDEDDMMRQASAILALGAKAVLLKGGHGSGDDSVDLFVTRDDVRRYAAKRIDTRNTHGTGCTLSSAIAAGLAKGMDLHASIAAAKDYVTRAIAAADRLTIGKGHGPVHHFHGWW